MSLVDAVSAGNGSFTTEHADHSSDLLQEGTMVRIVMLPVFDADLKPLRLERGTAWFSQGRGSAGTGGASGSWAMGPSGCFRICLGGGGGDNM